MRVIFAWGNAASDHEGRSSAAAEAAAVVLIKVRRFMRSLHLPNGVYGAMGAHSSGSEHLACFLSGPCGVKWVRVVLGQLSGNFSVFLRTVRDAVDYEVD